MVYAVLRYHVYGGVSWNHLPLWTTNKAVSFTAAILLAAAYLVSHPALGLRFGIAGFCLAALHSLMTLTLLTPQYYAKLYEQQRFTLAGELAMLTGILVLVILVIPAVASIPAVSRAMEWKQWKRCQQAGYWALALTGAHVLAIGYSGWFRPDTWPATMPPITILSAVVVLVPILRKFWRMCCRP